MAAATKASPAATAAPDTTPRKSYLDRLRDKWGGKPLTVAAVSDELTNLDAEQQRQRARMIAIESELVDADGAAMSQLHAEHYALTLSLRTGEQRQQQLLAERQAAQARDAVAEYAARADAYKRRCDAQHLLDAGELAAAWQMFLALRKQSNEGRYQINRQQFELGEFRLASLKNHPTLAAEFDAIEQSIAADLHTTWRPQAELEPEGKLL